MVTKGQEYHDIGSEKYEQKVNEHLFKYLTKKAKTLGFQLTEIAV